jgi:hypothetical protein
MSAPGPQRRFAALPQPSVSGPGSPAQSNGAAMPVANSSTRLEVGSPIWAEVVPPRRRLQPALDEAVYLPVIQFADDVSPRGLKDFEVCRLRRSPQYEAAQHLRPSVSSCAEVATFPGVICHDQVSVAPSLSSSFLPSCLSSPLPIMLTLGRGMAPRCAVT